MKILRLKEVIERVGLSKSTISDMRKRGEFPAPLQITERAVGWLDDDIDLWIEQRIQGTDEERRSRCAANVKP